MRSVVSVETYYKTKLTGHCDFCTWFTNLVFCIRRGTDELAEEQFCETHQLNMSILRMAYDAKMQLKDILCELGFPEHCMHPAHFNYRGLDENLDLVMIKHYL